MVKALAESGSDVALMFVSSDRTHDIAAQIGKDYGITCKAYKADIGKDKQVQAAVDQIHEDFGKIDIFVANAGISSRGASEVRKRRKREREMKNTEKFYRKQRVLIPRLLI